MPGVNRAIKSRSTFDSYSLESRTAKQDKPCIFLSHKSIDKETVEAIGEYIMKKADIDIYLDIYDDNLQAAVANDDAKSITTSIENGISNSTHTMCLISRETAKSWWVPYELGYAKRSNKEISSMKLKGNIELPSFLKVERTILGTKSLNLYLDEIITSHNKKELSSTVYDSLGLESYSNPNHPLDNYLDWNQ